MVTPDVLGKAPVLAPAAFKTSVPPVTLVAPVIGLEAVSVNCPPVPDMVSPPAPPERAALMMALPAELLTVNEGAVRVPFWIVLPPAPAAVMVTAARFGDEPPRSTRPPFNVNAPPLPRSAAADRYQAAVDLRRPGIRVVARKRQRSGGRVVNGQTPGAHTVQAWAIVVL